MGCRTCDLIREGIAEAAAVLAFLDEHGTGHQIWIDLSANDGGRLPG